MKTIQQLRKEGYKIRVIHERIVKLEEDRRDLSARLVAQPRGGKTIIEVTTPNQEHSVFAVAECSKKDNFNRKIGNRVALRRAFQQLEAISTYRSLNEIEEVF
jgi:hypothetical protein